MKSSSRIRRHASLILPLVSTRREPRIPQLGKHSAQFLIPLCGLGCTTVVRRNGYTKFSSAALPPSSRDADSDSARHNAIDTSTPFSPEVRFTAGLIVHCISPGENGDISQVIWSTYTGQEPSLMTGKDAVSLPYGNSPPDAIGAILAAAIRVRLGVQSIAAPAAKDAKQLFVHLSSFATEGRCRGLVVPNKQDTNRVPRRVQSNAAPDGRHAVLALRLVQPLTARVPSGLQQAFDGDVIIYHCAPDVQEP